MKTRFLFDRLHDRSGAVLVYLTLLLPILIGGAVIVVDAARLSNMHTSLQKAADALAIAAAAELDLRPGARARATAAINAALVSNSQEFGVTPGSVTVQAPRFLNGLPANDNDPIGSSFNATSDGNARFVEVIVVPTAFNTIFPASYIGGANAVNASATAVAGFTLGVCKLTPLFMCNPFEGTGISIEQAVTNQSYRRRQIELRQIGGGSSQFFPGNYGFLQPLIGNPGADALRDMLAMESPPVCFSQAGVATRPGFIATTGDAINVRFDLFAGAMNAAKNNANMRPAKNVTKGYIKVSQGQGQGQGNTNPCNVAPTDPANPNAMKLPRDTCFSGTCPHMGGRMGDGAWDFDAYWAMNHANNSVPVDAQGTAYSNSNLPTRYQIYRYEVNNTMIPQAGVTSSLTQENGNTASSACHASGGVDTASIDRRLVYGAVLNCQALAAAGYQLAGSTPNLPVEAFVSWFITEPVGNAQDQSLWVEIVDIIAPGSGAPGSNQIARDMVQLYR